MAKHIPIARTYGINPAYRSPVIIREALSYCESNDGDMRFLAWHVDYLRAEPVARGRSALVEESKPVRAENALLVFANFEKTDESHQADVIDNAISEIASIAAQLKITTIVLNPFAHLFAEPSKPEVAINMLDQLCSGLAKRDFDVQRLAFGMFYELELKAKGHRLSRIARSIS
jgi:threonyl-tRNA synthetase